VEICDATEAILLIDRQSAEIDRLSKELIDGDDADAAMRDRVELLTQQLEDTRAGAARDRAETELVNLQAQVGYLLNVIRSLPDARLRNELCDAFYGAAK